MRFGNKLLEALGNVGSAALGAAAQTAVEAQAKSPTKRRRRKTECTPCAAKARVLAARDAIGR